MGNIAPWNNPEVRWVCEEHPTKDQSHRLWFGFGKECGGAGMPENKCQRTGMYIDHDPQWDGQDFSCLCGLEFTTKK